MSLDLPPSSSPACAGRSAPAAPSAVVSCPRGDLCIGPPAHLGVSLSSDLHWRPSKPSSWAVCVCDPVPVPRRCPAHHASWVLPAHLEDGMAPGRVLTARTDCPSPTRDTDSEQRAGGPLGCGDLPGTDKLTWDGVRVGTERERRPVLPGVPWAPGPSRAERLPEVPGLGGPVLLTPPCGSGPSPVHCHLGPQ
uniref:Uncharacterized protein n=1 Tax=Myotis myotis TaxID=51298 RepID=A0A7J7R9P4_MYOMY|nr:hypothetical protein mMyoMyo1_010869 [Myotis myotis]